MRVVQVYYKVFDANGAARLETGDEFLALRTAHSMGGNYSKITLTETVEKFDIVGA